MAVMLRTSHIPSRIVNGFRSGEFNDLTGQYVVRASNAHSWVEAYFPGSGWISFDPTPAGSLPVRTGWSRIQLYVDAAASFWREWIINYDASHQRAFGKDAMPEQPPLLRRSPPVDHESAPLVAADRLVALHKHVINFPVRWLASGSGNRSAVIVLLNFRRLLDAIRAHDLRAHPKRAPREVCLALV